MFPGFWNSSLWNSFRLFRVTSILSGLRDFEGIQRLRDGLSSSLTQTRYPRWPTRKLATMSGGIRWERSRRGSQSGVTAVASWSWS